MSTHEEKRMDILQRKLRARTRSDGRPLPGYEQNVAAIRAEMEIIGARASENSDGN